MARSIKPSEVGFEHGDTVYARSDAGPVVLKVLASGKDGFTGEDNKGERHKLPHDRYLGHQRRVKHSYRIADEGEDGSLLEDETGNRRFIQGKPPSNPDGPNRDNANRFAQVHTRDHKPDENGRLVKAIDLGPLPMLPGGIGILLKADGSATAVRPVNPAAKADKSPKKSPEPEEKEKPKGPAKHKHGDYVAFRHENVEGHGRIVGSGQDGVTIEDEETGREHLVRHDAILDKHPPDPKALENSDEHGIDSGKEPEKTP